MLEANCLFNLGVSAPPLIIAFEYVSSGKQTLFLVPLRLCLKLMPWRLHVDKLLCELMQLLRCVSGRIR